MTDIFIERLKKIDNRLEILEAETQRLSDLLNELEHATLNMVDEKIEKAMLGVVFDDELESAIDDLRSELEG